MEEKLHALLASNSLTFREREAFESMLDEMESGLDITATDRQRLWVEEVFAKLPREPESESPYVLPHERMRIFGT